MNYSEIIAGTMTWGSWGKKLSTSEMAQLICSSVSQGVTTFDHADIYGGYTTEEEFGKAFKDSGTDRQVVQFITKCGIQYLAEKRNNSIKHYDLSGDYIIWSVEESLKNLQTDYLDLLLLHRPSPLMEADEIAAAVSRLKKEGKIRDFGLSNFTPTQTDLIRSKVAVSVNQIQFSLTHFEAMLNGSLDHMQLHGIQPMAWSPLGTVFKEYTDQTKRIKALLEELAPKYNATADQLLIAWLMRHPAKIRPVIGTTSPERITRATEALKITLETEDYFKMWVESQGHKVP